MEPKFDHERLVKFMRMTESDNDGEALAALRMANKLIKAAGKNWADVLPDPGVAERKLFEAFTYKQRGQQYDARRYSAGPQKFGEPLRQRHPPQRDDTKHRDEDIPMMLNALATRKGDTLFLMFVASVRQHWTDKGWLGTTQLVALRRVYTTGRL